MSIGTHQTRIFIYNLLIVLTAYTALTFAQSVPVSAPLINHSLGVRIKPAFIIKPIGIKTQTEEEKDFADDLIVSVTAVGKRCAMNGKSAINSFIIFFEEDNEGILKMGA